MLNYNLSLIFLIRLDYFLIFPVRRTPYAVRRTPYAVRRTEGGRKNHIRVVSEDPTLALDIQFGFLLIVHCNILRHFYQIFDAVSGLVD